MIKLNDVTTLKLQKLMTKNHFFCHDGHSSDLHLFEQIRCLARSTDVPDTGLFCDLLWFDLNKDTLECREIDHGVSVIFGAEVVTRYLTPHKIDLICRRYLSYMSELQHFRTIAFLKFFLVIPLVSVVQFNSKCFFLCFFSACS